MSELITYPLPAGPVYTIPDVGDVNWGQNVTNFLVAVPSGTVPTAGTFTLTGDVTFAGGFGLLSTYFKTPAMNPASAGFVRLSKTDVIDWRNNANSADLPLAINGSDQLMFNGTLLVPNGSSPTFSSLTLSSPLTVPNGGTGDTSFSAYSVLCGGTTSTGALQTVSGVGLSGQALVSNGPAMLPTWQNVAGTGTVNSGTINHLAYYASSSNIISSLPALSYSGTTLTFQPTSPSSAELDIIGGGSGSTTATLQLQGNGQSTNLKTTQIGDFTITDVDNARTFFTYTRATPSLSVTVPLGANLAAGAHKITGLAAGTTTGDAISYGQGFDAGNNKITGLAAPTTTGDALSRGNAVVATSGTFSGIVTIPHTGSDTTPGLAFDNSSNSGLFGSITAGSIEIVSNGLAVASSNPTVSTGFNIRGTNTNDAANTGFVGEYIASEVTSVNFAASGVISDMATITLTAGDWEVCVGGSVDSGGTTSLRDASWWSSTTAGDSSTGESPGTNTFRVNIGSNVASFSFAGAARPYRYSLTGSTIIRLKAYAVYTSSTPVFNGGITARRMR